MPETFHAWFPVLSSFYRYYSIAALACEQALRRAASAGREKEEELATTSLEFEYQCIEKVDEKF